MKYGYVVHDDDLGMQLIALEECDQIGDDLSAILNNLKSNDELVVWRIDKLASSIDGLKLVIDRVHHAGATVALIYEQISSVRGNESQLSQLIEYMNKIKL
ncbi:hypothetical protein CAG61_08330 [Vibrio sp. V34_P3A8T189]|uniref:hypothetical protein n=1 Tax=unclassified Vibrio TaxID=2614977 RepID=UPI001372F461|nr:MULTISPECIES: hypothetical protein [unclassified Vibrio]NAW78361.1 hypothetical protein [Vibrio sp. V33_P6A3T137]NAX01860.1 hypothetical protein [Vibrio sp. V34_P3A8T189]NAX08261.1 hypothetical protein [Vibrio sp. V40_P2S30T141]